MRKIACAVLMMVCSIAVFAKEKETIQIEVVGSQAWQRDVPIHHAATNGTANTDCNSNGNVNAATYGDNTYGSINSTTNCTTTTTPGRPAYTDHYAIQQESVHAIVNGQRVTLWCQVGFRKCADLAAGTYTAEVDGDKALKIYVYSLTSRKLMGKMKYRVAGSW